MISTIQQIKKEFESKTGPLQVDQVSLSGRLPLSTYSVF